MTMKDEKKTGKKTAKTVDVKLESILDLNASNVWNLDEYAIAEAWEKERNEDDFTVSEQKLLGVIRLAFEVVHYNPEDERDKAKYENGGWARITHCRAERGCAAIRRKTIERITDLSYENIKHIGAPMLLELISRNFGGGWNSISLAIRDIIETGFDISTTQLPASRIHAPGGTLEKKVAQGFEVLEITKGSWVEAIFAKKKDPIEKFRMDVNERQYDEDGNLITYDDEQNETDDFGEDAQMDNDDTYFSSLSPEVKEKDMDDDGFGSIEEVGDED